MSAPDAGHGGPGEDSGDAACWREAERLRGEFRGWVVIWLAPAGQFKAYRRMPGARRDTALSDATADGIAAQITQAERASRPATGRRSGRG